MYSTTAFEFVEMGIQMQKQKQRRTRRQHCLSAPTPTCFTRGPRNVLSSTKVNHNTNDILGRGCCGRQTYITICTGFLILFLCLFPVSPFLRGLSVSLCTCVCVCVSFSLFSFLISFSLSLLPFLRLSLHSWFLARPCSPFGLRRMCNNGRCAQPSADSEPQRRPHHQVLYPRRANTPRPDLLAVFANARG